MSAHKNDDSRLRGALAAHHLAVDGPSQLSDAFRAGVRWADANPAATPAPVQEKAAPSDAVDAIVPAHIERLISAYGYANRHPEDADGIARAHRALVNTIGPQPAASAEPYAVLTVHKHGAMSVLADGQSLREKPITDEDRKFWREQRGCEIVEVFRAPVAAQPQPSGNTGELRQLGVTYDDIDRICREGNYRTAAGMIRADCVYVFARDVSHAALAAQASGLAQDEDERQRVGEAISQFMADNAYDNSTECCLDWADASNIDALMDVIDSARRAAGGEHGN